MSCFFAMAEFSLLLARAASRARFGLGERRRKGKRRSHQFQQCKRVARAIAVKQLEYFSLPLAKCHRPQFPTVAFRNNHNKWGRWRQKLNHPIWLHAGRLSAPGQRPRAAQFGGVVARAAVEDAVVR